SGKLLWHHAGSTGQLGYNADRREFLGIEWPPEKGGTKSLVLFGSGGEVKARFPLGSSIIEEFCLSGTRLLSSSGWLIDTATGKVAAYFDFPMTDYPDK